MEATDHIVQENETQDDGLYIGDKIVQQNASGTGDITAVSYTHLTLPTTPYV